MTAVKVHAFWPDGTALDWDGRPGCAHCPLPATNPIHQVDELPEEVREMEDRKLGEEPD